MAESRGRTSNEKHGGGPQTSEGKAIRRYNAVTTGRTTSQVPLPHEAAQFELYEASVYSALKPVDAIEAELVRRIVALSWRLRRFDLWDAIRIQAYAAHELEDQASSPYTTQHTTDHITALALVPDRTTASETVERASRLERGLHTQLLQTLTALKELRIP
jgi:hypothetical protein